MKLNYSKIFEIRIMRLILIASLIPVLLSFKSYYLESETNFYKCMIQLKNYDGEGAYIVVSLLNPNGEYEKTLYVQGQDDDWYSEIFSWWKFYGKKRNNIDGITAATVRGGERTVQILEIEKTKINSGYFLRFESAVEDIRYYQKEIELEITDKNLKKQTKGKGFIKYIRMIEQVY